MKRGNTGATSGDRARRSGHRGLTLLAGVLGAGVLLPTALAAPAATEDPRRIDGGAVAESNRQSRAALLPPRVGDKTVIRAAVPRKETSLADLRLSVQGFRIDNHPFIDGEAIDAVLAPWKGKELSFPEFEQAVHAVAEYLRRNGHPNARVMVSRAAVGNGTVAVAVQDLSPGQPTAPTVAVREFDVTGVTVATADELRGVLEPWAERDLSVAEMQGAAEAIAAHLRNKGYPLAQAYLPPQRIDGGVIRIEVQEGKVDGSMGRDGISVETSGERVKPQVVETVLARGVTAGEPVRTAQLERALRLASDIPGIRSVKATLGPGSEPGSTHVLANVEEGRLLSGSVWVDNHGNRYSGAERLSAVLNLNSPLGFGDLISLDAAVAERMHSAKLAVSVPLGADGMRVGASYSDMRVDIGEEFRSLDLNSQTRITSVFGSYPLLRGEGANAWLSLNYDDKVVRNDLLGTRLNDRKLQLTTLALSGDVIDAWRGQTWWSLSMTGGHLDNNGDQPSTEGGFSRVNAGATRLAPITADGKWSWYARLNGQYASKNLDSVEKFQLGGPGGVRAYPVGEGLGDHGWIANLEVRNRVASTAIGDIDLFGFFDAGGITQFDSVKAGDQLFGPNTYTLKGYGVGASLSNGERGNLRVVVARKAGSNPNPTADGSDSDGQKRDARVWIFGNIQF